MTERCVENSRCGERIMTLMPAPLLDRHVFYGLHGRRESFPGQHLSLNLSHTVQCRSTVRVRIEVNSHRLFQTELSNLASPYLWTSPSIENSRHGLATTWHRGIAPGCRTTASRHQSTAPRRRLLHTAFSRRVLVDLPCPKSHISLPTPARRPRQIPRHLQICSASRLPTPHSSCARTPR